MKESLILLVVSKLWVTQVSGLPSYQNQNSALQEGVFLSEQIFLKSAEMMTFFEMK